MSRYSTHRKSAFCALLCAAALASVEVASAQTLYFWTGTAGGANWSTPSNWNNASQGGPVATTVPGNASNDGVTINQGSSSGSPVTLNNLSTTTIGALNLGSTTSGTAYLAVSGTGTKLRPSTATSYLIGSGGSSVVGLNVNQGAELEYVAATALSVGSGSNSSVTVTVAGTMRNTGAASTTTFAGGADSDATLNINSGGLVNLAGSGQVIFGNGVGSAAIVNVATGGLLNITGQVRVGNGNNSVGNLNVSGGQVTLTSALNLGNGGSGVGNLTLSSGTVSVTGNSTFNVGSNVNITGGLYTMATGVSMATSGTFVLNGGTVAVGTGLSFNAGSVGTISSGSAVTVSGGAGRLTLNGGSLSIGGGTVDLVGNASTISGGSVLTQTSGSATFSALTVGNSGTGTYSKSGGSLVASSLNVGSGVNGNGNLTLTGGSTTVGGLITVGSGTAVTGGFMGVQGSTSLLHNNANGASNTITVGTSSGTGSAGQIFMQGGTIAPAVGATNGSSVVLATPATLTSAVTTSSIQGYGTFNLGGTGNKTFTQGGKVIATGANLVNNTGASPTDQTLDFTGATFSVLATPNRSAGAGWYAVNHGKLSMNVSGTVAATTLNWGAPTGSLATGNLVNSAQLTFNASTAPSAISISLLATDRTDIAALFGQAGLPAGPGNVIGLWDMVNGSANTWTGLSFRYDDALAGGQSPVLYYIPNSAGTWSQIATTVDLLNFTISDNVASLNSGYYALLVVPEPGSAALLAAGSLLLLARRKRTRRIA